MGYGSSDWSWVMNDDFSKKIKGLSILAAITDFWIKIAEMLDFTSDFEIWNKNMEEVGFWSRCVRQVAYTKLKKLVATNGF